MPCIQLLDIMKKNFACILLGSLALAATGQSQIVNANNGVLGDMVTTAGSAITVPITSYAGSNGEFWQYTNVRFDGKVGIDTALPRSGTASARFQTPGAPISTNARADIQLTGPKGLGMLDGLTQWASDAYTASSATPNQAPIIRLNVLSATDTRLSGSGAMFGELVWDTTWNPSTAPVFGFGAWQNIDLMANANSIMVRGTGEVGIKYNDTNNQGERTLASYLSLLASKDYVVTAAGAGFGGTNLQFDGAVDNYTLGFNGNSKTFNFEAVPEPTSMIALGLGAIALIKRRRK